jgi:transcriptional regulator with XRE-family HTH domain
MIMNEDADRAALGARLRDAREYRGFSQEDVAKVLRVPRSAVSLIESGARRLDIMELRRLAELYQCRIEELTGEQQPQTQADSITMVARAAAKLSPGDRTEVLRFAEFLQARKRASDDGD